MKYLLKPLRKLAMRIFAGIVSIIISLIVIVIVSWVWHFSFRKIKYGNSEDTYKEWWDDLVEFIMDGDWVYESKYDYKNK